VVGVAKKSREEVTRPRGITLATSSHKHGSQANAQRLRVTIHGAVQGVGFRPFIYKLADSLSLTGWITNSSQGVTIEVEGAKTTLESFLDAVRTEKPPQSFIHSLETSYLDTVGYASFEIRASEDVGRKTAIVLPDIATCAQCRQEVLDPDNRRYRYPFTNCTNCGPRFSIIQALPYDRPNTTMSMFPMCEECRSEYDDPTDRRFHAQPNACPRCGPHVELWNPEGKILTTHHQAITEAARAVDGGNIVAVKGIGGFHLVVDARNEHAVKRLRERKHREEKPLALMYPSLAAIENHCAVSRREASLLRSSASPIVLLLRRSTPVESVAPSIAPANPYLGVMLPYTPLHHILLAELERPIVATSGNLSDEPICTDEREALERLRAIADVFLVHDRPIARHVDDSIVRLTCDREQVLRRARGYAPLPFRLKEKIAPTLAVGAHLKNTVAISVDDQVFVSQHIGDLETDTAYQAFERVIESFKQLYNTEPQAVLCDAHPDYLSTRYARRLGVPVHTVQHHVAHVLACMVENDLAPPLLGVSWDGTGYGTDGTVWGGEFFHLSEKRIRRIAHLRTFPLPGGEQAVKEPRRSALGLLHELRSGDMPREDLAPHQSFSVTERTLLTQMLERGVNSPYTSSIGRLFDVVASLVGLRHVNRFEGQAAMELEYQIVAADPQRTYPLTFRTGERSMIIIDWEPMILRIVADVGAGVSCGMIATRFHNTLAEAVITIAKQTGLSNVVLTGGCFQNKYLSEQTITRLTAIGLRPYWHQRISPNDGGIALGQIGAVTIDHALEE